MSSRGGAGVSVIELMAYKQTADLSGPGGRAAQGTPGSWLHQTEQLGDWGTWSGKPNPLTNASPHPYPQLEAPILDVLGTLPRKDVYLSVLVFPLL